MDHPGIDVAEVVTKTEYFQESLNKLLDILQPSYYCLDLVIKVLVHGPDGSGKRILAKAAAENLNMKFQEERVSDLFDENIVGTEKKVRAAITKYAGSDPILLYLSGLEIFTYLEAQDLTRVEYCIREVVEDLQQKGMEQPLVLLAGTSDFQTVYKTVLSNMFHHDLCLGSPDVIQSRQIIDVISDCMTTRLDANQILAKCNKGEFYLGNILASIAEFLLRLVPPRVDEGSEQEILEEGTRWVDIGGLTSVKQEIVDTIQLSLDYPQIRKTGLRRTGVLLYGPPGTGKTMLARAIATECSLHFLSVKGPELLNEYVGQSEDNVRKLFQKARDLSPSVIFFDEIDSLAPNRGQAGDSGGVMDRIVSQILAEMDGVGGSDGVFVIGATNRVDLVDPSLLRPGRFDKVLEVPLPRTKESRLQILQALTRKMELAKDVDLDEIESLVPQDMTGADIQGLCSKAIQRSFDRCVQLVESSQSSEEEVEIITTREDFICSLPD